MRGVPTALGASVAAAQAAGPVAVDPGVVAFIEALDPAALGDDDFDGLLAASRAGRRVRPTASLELPSRMAEVNAMLDVASPAMREALLVAFLDRLQRPVRWTPMTRRSSALAGAGREGAAWPPTGRRRWPRSTTRSRRWVGSCARRTRRPRLPARRGDLVFRAFQRPLADVRVLVVGQDPYPNPAHPIGLSFAVERHVWPLPPSLLNIYVELRDDLGIVPPRHGDLSAWADQGVMLLNRA